VVYVVTKPNKSLFINSWFINTNIVTGRSWSGRSESGDRGVEDPEAEDRGAEDLGAGCGRSGSAEKLSMEGSGSGRFIVYYISNEYNRNAGLTVDRCDLLVSIYVTIPLLDAALSLKSITKNWPMREFGRESI